jgi:hypothetical protein
MTRDQHRQARKRQSRIADETAAQFDTAICHNVVYSHLKGVATRRDDHLGAVLDLAERAFELEKQRDRSDRDSVAAALFDAADTLDDQVDALVDEEVALACRSVLDTDWDDGRDPAAIANATHEAHEWLVTHPAAAQRARVGVPGQEVNDAK